MKENKRQRQDVFIRKASIVLLLPLGFWLGVFAASPELASPLTLTEIRSSALAAAGVPTDAHTRPGNDCGSEYVVMTSS